MSITELLKLAIEERGSLPPELVIHMKGSDLIELYKYIREDIRNEQGISKQDTFDEILNVAGASKLTGYAEQSIYVMISKKQIPYIKRGARVFFERDRLIAWIKENKIEPQKIEEEDDEIENYLTNRKKKSKRA